MQRCLLMCFYGLWYTDVLFKQISQRPLMWLHTDGNEFHASFTSVSKASWVPPGSDKNIKVTNDREAKRTPALQQGINHRLWSSLLSDMIQRENSPVRPSFSLAWSEVWECGSECSLPTQLECGPQTAPAEQHYATTTPLCTAEG